jgi:hypothetical protein
MHFGKKYVYKIYLCVCPIELAHSKEITSAFEQKPVTVAIIWKENKFQQMVHLFHKMLNCIYIRMDVCMFHQFWGLYYNYLMFITFQFFLFIYYMAKTNFKCRATLYRIIYYNNTMWCRYRRWETLHGVCLM